MSGHELLIIIPALVVLATCWIVSERIARFGKATGANNSTMVRSSPAERETLEAAFQATHASSTAETRKGAGGQPYRSPALRHAGQIQEPKSAD